MPHNLFSGAARRARAGEGSTVQRDVLGTTPFRLGEQFSDIAQQGLFGEEDIQNIFGARRRVRGAQRSALGRGLRSSLGRRLGSRSGAVSTLITNRVSAPSLIAEQQDLSNLLQRNVESRGIGLRGMMAILNFLQARREGELNREQAGTGLLDFLGPVGAIAGGPIGGLIGSGARKLFGGGGRPD